MTGKLDTGGVPCARRVGVAVRNREVRLRGRWQFARGSRRSFSVSSQSRAFAVRRSSRPLCPTELAEGASRVACVVCHRRRSWGPLSYAGTASARCRRVRVVLVRNSSQEVGDLTKRPSNRFSSCRDAAVSWNARSADRDHRGRSTAVAGKLSDPSPRGRWTPPPGRRSQSGCGPAVSTAPRGSGLPHPWRNRSAGDGDRRHAFAFFSMRISPNWRGLPRHRRAPLPLGAGHCRYAQRLTSARDDPRSVSGVSTIRSAALSPGLVERRTAKSGVDRHGRAIPETIPAPVISRWYSVTRAPALFLGSKPEIWRVRRG